MAATAGRLHAIFVFLLPLLSPVGSKQSLSDLVEELLSRRDYNSRIRPGADSGEPMTIWLNIHISDISSISEVRMEYSMTLFLRQTWRDHRLAYTGYNKSITLNYNQYNRLWTPDLFIRNLKAGQFHTITVPNRLIRLDPDGSVLYSQRLSLTLACDMLLEKYPMDNQTCMIDFGSYGYTTEDLIFKWKEVKNPVDVNPGISLPEFYLMGAEARKCATKYSVTGSFPCLKAFLFLKRRLKFYILQIYLPSLLIVLLSMVSFWIDLDAVPARTSLGILTILTVTTQSAGINMGLPAVSFTKAIDVWMATCLVFVFGAFIEYSVVNVLARKNKKKAKIQRERSRVFAGNSFTPVPTNGGEETELQIFQKSTCPTSPSSCSPEHVDQCCRQRLTQKNGRLEDEGTEYTTLSTRKPTYWQRVQTNKALMVDVISRVLFPVLFLLFNIIYWPLYFL